MNKQSKVILNDPSVRSLLKSINDFFESIGPADSINSTSQLISVFLEKAVNEDSDYEPRLIESVVSNEIFKNQFITRIFESWTQIKNQHEINGL